MDNREYDERRRSTFLWGGVAGRLDKHIITSREGGDFNIKTGIPPKMKAEHTERWRLARENAEIERLMGWRSS
jgi:hypothetical protein